MPNLEKLFHRNISANARVTFDSTIFGPSVLSVIWLGKKMSRTMSYNTNVIDHTALLAEIKAFFGIIGEIDERHDPNPGWEPNSGPDPEIYGAGGCSGQLQCGLDPSGLQQAE